MKIVKELVITVKRGKYEIGYIIDNEFTAFDKHTGEIPSGYIPLYDFLKLSNPKISFKESEQLRKEIGYTKIFVYVEDNADFWAHTNHKCNTCKKKCKQSSKVAVMVCPQFEPIDG